MGTVVAIILAVIGVISVIVVYGSCVVAGETDEVMARLARALLKEEVGDD